VKPPDENEKRVRLRTGRIVILGRCGWRQPPEQFERLGPVSEAEAAEAWERATAYAATRRLGSTP
jgi:hypothetical protein